MNPSVDVLLADLIPFMERLRSSGYSISTNQIMSAHWLLTSMAERDAIPEDPVDLVDWIGPIVCSSPAEQADFPRKFGRWLDSLRNETKPALAPSKPSEPASIEREYLKALNPLRRRGVLSIAGAALLVVMVTIPLVSSFSRKSPPIDGPEPTVVPTAPPPTLEARVESASRVINDAAPRALTIAGEIGFVLFCGVWILLRQIRRSAETINRRQIESLRVERRDSDEAPTHALKLRARTPWSPAGREAHRRAATALLERRDLDPDPRHIDVRSTVDRLVRDEGRFEPVPARRRATPEYLALVDRVGAHDHQADWAEAILDAAAESLVSVTRFEFARDPRSCRPTSGPARGRPHTLRDLAERYPDHRLLIFTSGEGLIDPKRGKPAAWLEKFSAWPGRVIFTFRPRASWGGLETGLVEAGFLVATATPQGVAEASVELAGLSSTAKGWSNTVPPIPVPPIPKPLRDEPERWIDSTPPPDAEIDVLLEGLRWYLDDDYPWLAACAVYPELRWDLTRELGKVAVGRTESTDALESGLARLIRLPWFREGSLPDWLRLRLIANLPSELKEKVRDAVNQLILGAETVELDHFPRRSLLSQIVDPRRGVLGGPAAEVRRVALESDPAGPWSDPVLAYFLDDKRPSELEDELPRNVVAALEAAPPEPSAAPAAEPVVAAPLTPGPRMPGWAIFSLLTLFVPVVAPAVFLAFYGLFASPMLGVMGLLAIGLYSDRLRLARRLDAASRLPWWRFLAPAFVDLALAALSGLGAGLVAVGVGSAFFTSLADDFGGRIMLASVVVCSIHWIVSVGLSWWRFGIQANATAHRVVLKAAGVCFLAGAAAYGIAMLIPGKPEKRSGGEFTFNVEPLLAPAGLILLAFCFCLALGPELARQLALRGWDAKAVAVGAEMPRRVRLSATQFLGKLFQFTTTLPYLAGGSVLVALVGWIWIFVAWARPIPDDPSSRYVNIPPAPGAAPPDTPQSPGPTVPDSKAPIEPEPANPPQPRKEFSKDSPLPSVFNPKAPIQQEPVKGEKAPAVPARKEAPKS